MPLNRRRPSPFRPTSPLRLTRHTPDEARAIVSALVDVYARVYNVPPYVDDPFFTPEMFASRLHAAFDMEGFEVVTAHLDDDTLVGYCHGVTLTPDRAWWASLGDIRPNEMVKAAENGEVFWLRELMVLPEHGNAGVGHAIHDATVGGRIGQPWTTLTCIPDNEPAHGAYLRWGYETIGQVKHAPESPVYDAMLLAPAHP